MADLLAIDPGVNTGWAYFDGGRLRACGLGDPRSADRHIIPDEVIVEVPVIYPGGRTKNPNAVLKTAVSAGYWLGVYGAAVHRMVPPRTWKGTVPKEIHHPRVLAKLSAAERAVIDAVKLPKSKKHNVVDAVGLGLYAVGR